MTAQAITIIEVDSAEGIAPADVARRLALPTAKPRDEAIALSNFFAALADKSAKVRVRVDSSQGVAAARTVAITGANIAAGEWIGIVTPRGSWKVTGVASGAVSGDGTFNVSGTDATAATNIAAAVNSLAGLSEEVIASTNSGDLIITARRRGTIGNLYRIVDGTVNGLSASGLLSGGLDTDQRVTASVAITNANLTAATDTLTIGATVLTWVAGAPANENQVQIGAVSGASGDNLVAAINAHSALRGIITAANASGTVTLTYQVSPRVALHIRLATNDGTAMALVQPNTSLTLSNAQLARTYELGAPR